MEDKDKKSTKKPKGDEPARQKLALFNNCLTPLPGEERMEDRAGSPVPALSFAVTSDKSIPKTAAPQVLRLAQLECISQFVGIWPSSMPHLQLTVGNNRTRINTFQVTKTLGDNYQQAIINRVNYKLYRPQRSSLSQGNIYSSSGNSCENILFPAEGGMNLLASMQIFLPLATTEVCTTSLSAKHKCLPAESLLRAEGVQLLFRFS